MFSKLWITLPAEVGSLAAVATAVREVLDELRASQATVEAVELCVGEAVNSAIERHRPSQRRNRVEIQLNLLGDSLQIVVGDRGEPLPSEPSEPAFDPEDRASWPETGMGLHLIRQLMSDVQFRSDTTRNVIQMSCSLKVP